jgi:cellobiose phosphorylase
MQYGYFDDKAKEYVITVRTRRNLEQLPRFHRIRRNHHQQRRGYGFYQSGARGRFLRLRFNSVPLDQPGRYFYLRDDASGDFWSASWQPSGNHWKVFRALAARDSLHGHFKPI